MIKLRINFNLIALTLIYGVFLAGCASSMQTMSLNSAKKTSELYPGMPYEQVVDMLGKPKSSQMVGDQWVVRWVLQEVWVGYVPYDFVFNPDDRTLISWSKNEKDFQKSQENLKVITEAVEQAAAESNASSGSGNASPTGPNDEALMQRFAVKLYRFSAVGGGQTGGSETIINLCPDGTFRSGSETGYSGEGWGSDAQGGDHGTWRITGNMQRGEIVFVHANGQAWKYNYVRVEGDYVTLNDTKYGLAGYPDCR